MRDLEEEEKSQYFKSNLFVCSPCADSPWIIPFSVSKQTLFPAGCCTLLSRLLSGEFPDLYYASKIDLCW